MLCPRIRLAFALAVLGFSGSVGGQTLTSTTLPILEIDVAHADIPDEPKVVAAMRLVYNGPGVANSPGGPTSEYVGDVGIELRGSTSQTLFPKTGYGLELRTAANADTSARLLGMPREEDWVLHGPYSDKTLVRNAFAYTLAGELMDYAPRVRFVELLLGGEYRGIYLLTERIKRDGDRVDIARLDGDDVAGDSLTGGYILKFDKLTAEADAGGAGFTLPAVGLPGARPSKLVFHYPRPDRIAPEQAAYILGVIDRFEGRLAAPNFDDPAAGYAPLIDLQSFVDFALVNEATYNGDAYRLSTFLSKDRDDRDGEGRLRMGPVWDFNLALANRDFCPGPGPEGWMWRFNELCPDDFFYAPFWWPRLFDSRTFRRALADRYQALRQNGPLATAALHRRLDSLAAELPADAVARNFERWPVLGKRVWPNDYIADSHADAVGYVRGWLEARMEWMDEAVEELSSGGGDAPAREVSFAPNPGTGQAQLRGLTADDFPATFSWIDPAGREVMRYTALLGVQVRVPERAGVYTVRIRTASGQAGNARFIALGGQ